MAKALRKLGFRFVGPTTAYALMQATGMVDDHLADCYVTRRRHSRRPRPRETRERQGNRLSGLPSARRATNSALTAVGR